MTAINQTNTTKAIAYHQCIDRRLPRWPLSGCNSAVARFFNLGGRRELRKRAEEEAMSELIWWHIGCGGGGKGGGRDGESQ